jgi:ABC-2 type transport system ATP-binding protein
MNKKHPLQVENIVKNYKKHSVLNDVSFKIEEGEIYSLVGLNGIGKTTMIKIILGLAKADKGLIKLFGKDSESSKDVRQKICYLPEKFTPSAFLKGHEFLSICAGYYGKKYDKEEAASHCLELDFDPIHLEKKVSTYSKGMSQKLGLISIFLTGAPLLILDEPMSGLDPNARIYLKRKLKAYKEAGNSIFFTSHILADIEEICDRISILHNGTLHYEGDVKRLVKLKKTTNLEQAFLSVIGE